MYIFITVLAVIAAVILIILVLAQNSKGGGLAAGFSSSNQIMGVRKTTDFVEKATWGFACAIIVLSVAATFAMQGTPATGSVSAIKDEVENELQVDPNLAAPLAPQPQGGTAAPAAAPQAQPQQTQPQPVEALPQGQQ